MLGQCAPCRGDHRSRRPASRRPSAGTCARPALGRVPGCSRCDRLRPAERLSLPGPQELTRQREIPCDAATNIVRARKSADSSFAAARPSHEGHHSLALTHRAVSIKATEDAHRLKLHLEVGPQAAQDALLTIGLREHVPGVLVRPKMLQPLRSAHTVSVAQPRCTARKQTERCGRS